MLAKGLLLVEVVVGIAIINFVRYTEIDWKAYMQEVEGFIQGERDYVNLKGDTGPLVYPAGFVYVYSGLYYATDHGENIRRAQYIFLALYVIQQAIVFDVYRLAKLPTFLLPLLCLSKRIHSISLLRCFNDPIAMLLFYLSLNLLLRRRSLFSAIVLSLAISIKMNVLLPLPALGLIWVQLHGTIGAGLLSIVVVLVQLVLAIPFLTSHAGSYFSKAFEFSRVFQYEWTVNWRFLPESLFLSPGWAAALLAVHVLLLILFAFKWTSQNGGFLNLLTDMLSPSKLLLLRASPPTAPRPQHVAFIILTCNFIGIACSRTLHYQFYAWYFHSLPLLVWTALPHKLHTIPRFLIVAGIMGGVEFAFLTFPSTVLSSSVLQAAHWGLIALLLAGHVPALWSGKKE